MMSEVDPTRSVITNYTTLLTTMPESLGGLYTGKTTNVLPDTTSETRYVDAAGRLAKLITRRNQTYLFDYTNTGKPKTTRTPLNREFKTGYDSFGRLESQIEPSGQSRWTAYDSRDRVQRVDYKDAGEAVVASTAFGLDDRGNALTVTEGTAALTRTYDTRDRVTSYQNAAAQKIIFTYDDLNRLTKLTYPGNKIVSYTYDAAGRLKTVVDWSRRTTTYTYDAFSGRLSTILRPNGTRRIFVQDEAGQLIRIEERGPLKVGTATHDKPIAVFSLLFDGGGRLAKKALLPLPTKSASDIPPFDATFDADNRLVTLNGSAIDYDGAPATSDGNMTRSPLPPDLTQVTPPAQMASYGWDLRNRLTSVAITGGSTLTYTYDAEGNLIKRAGPVAADNETYVVNPHAGLSQTLMRQSSAGTTYYIYGTGLLYELFTATGSTAVTDRYYHFDQLGSTVAMTGKRVSTTTVPPILGRVEYSAYGMVTKNELKAINTPFLYVGEHGVMTDRSTGLMSMRARWFNPWMARFMSEDPIQFQGGMNWYGYCGGDPLSRVDPEGTFFHILIGAGVGGIVGVGGQFISDVIRGETSGFNQYAGAFVGGAVTGGLATATGGASLLVSTGARVAMVAGSGAVGAASGNLVEQGMGSRPFSGTELATKTVIGAATSLIPAPVIRVPGLNAGNGSWSHVANTQMTKLANGTTSSISSTTLGKIVGANVYRESTSMGYDGVAEASYSTWLEPMIRPSSSSGSLFNYSGGSSRK